MIDHIRRHTIPVALSLLPAKMTSPEAVAMLVAIGLQESLFRYRTQIGGPARGFWQFEQGGGVQGVLSHRSSSEHAAKACQALCYQPIPGAVYEAIAHNDTLACIFARLLLWTHPRALPGASDVDGAWRLYLDTWRPGKPHPETWAENYARAWQA